MNNLQNTNGEQNDVIIYQSKDGKINVALMTRDGNVWLNQLQIATLFGTSVPNISMHIAKILKEGELDANSVIKNYLTTAADENAPNMGLTTWKGNIVRKGDIIIAKNYLEEPEIDKLNRLTTIFLESAEMRVKERKDLTLDFWRENVNALLTFQGQKILVGNGHVSNFDMEQYVKEIYARFDEKRKKYEAELADDEDMKYLDDLENEIKKKQ